MRSERPLNILIFYVARFEAHFDSVVFVEQIRCSIAILITRLAFRQPLGYKCVAILHLNRYVFLVLVCVNAKQLYLIKPIHTVIEGVNQDLGRLIPHIL